MFKNYLKVAVRNFWKHKGYSFINLSGLAAGMTCFCLILLYIQDEFRIKIPQDDYVQLDSLHAIDSYIKRMGEA